MIPGFNVGKLLISGGLVALICRYRWWLLFWIPLLPYAGLWTTDLTLDTSMRFVGAYLELALAGLCLYQWLCSNRHDRLSRYLFATGVLAIPALLQSGEHFLFSLSLTFLILTGPGVYHYFRLGMAKSLKEHQADYAVLLWVSLNIVVKVYSNYKYGLDTLRERSGGIWGTNHVAGVLLLLLPLVKRQWIVWVAIVSMLSMFSRGVYFAISLYFVLSLFESRRGLMRTLAGTAFLMLVLAVTVPTSVLDNFQEYLVIRVTHTSGRAIGGTMVGNSVDSIAQDDRWQIQRWAAEMAASTYFAGSGLGGFQWELPKLDYPGVFSNAHNVYLTCLAEGGILFALAVTGLIVYLLRVSHNVDRRVCVGLLVFAVYGIYSGELWEASGMITAGDYFNLLYVAAYIKYTQSLGRAEAQERLAATLASRGGVLEYAPSK